MTYGKKSGDTFVLNEKTYVDSKGEIHTGVVNGNWRTVGTAGAAIPLEEAEALGLLPKKKAKKPAANKAKNPAANKSKKATKKK